MDWIDSGLAQRRAPEEMDEIASFLCHRLDFFFDPFRYLEASSDPHLGQYLVGLEILPSPGRSHHLWCLRLAVVVRLQCGSTPSVRAGSALAALTHSRSPVFLLTSLPIKTHLTKLYLHLVCRSAACPLLLGLAYRPERFLRLDRTAAQEIVSLLDALLPTPLARWIAILEGDRSPVALVDRLDRAYQVTEPPSAD